MGILQELLKEIKSDDMTQQIREICYTIYEEESPNFLYPDQEPKGTNVFLALEVPGRYTKEIGYLTLERQSEELYVAIFHTLDINRINIENPEATPIARRQKVWEIDENKAEKILMKFAKICKMLRGE